MGRPPRIQFEGAFYHIFHRGNRRERIFWTDADYAQFEAFMLDAMNWSGVLLYDWSLLPNHFHLLVETPDGNIAEFMQRLATRYAKYFNWTHKKVGHLFQGRYGARVCDKETYFLELVRYIELNPYRLKKGKLADLGTWKWSSLRYYMGLEKPPEGMQVAMQRVLERFGKNPVEARKRMSQFLAEGLKAGDCEDFYQPRANRYLGDEAFIEAIKRGRQEPVRQVERRMVKLAGVEALSEKIQACFQVSQSDLTALSQQRSAGRIRKAFVYVGRYKYRFTTKALASYLQRQESAVSMMLKRMWTGGKQINEIATLLDQLEVKEVGELKNTTNCEV